MARDKATVNNIDKSDLVKYPNARVKDNTGSGDGTPVNELVYGDLHEFFAKLMRLAGILYNGLPDNEANGYQLIDALASFANKNDVVYDLGTSGGRLSINTKLGTLKENEKLLCLATVDLAAETQIRGTDNTNKSITKKGNFKAGEYVRLINTPASILVVRLGDNESLDSMVSELSFLKAATTPEELAGAINTKATTPMGNLLVFVEWVNGASSDVSLATAIRNGLYPKEHFQIVANIGNDRVRNIGFASGLDPGSGANGETFTVGGDIDQCLFHSKNDGATTWTFTMANEMDNTNYYVRSFYQSQGNIDHDDDLYPAVFVPISTTQFRLRIDEDNNKVQNIKLHLEVVQIS